MDKKSLILLLILLTGCDNKTIYTCSKYIEDNELRFTITSNYDDIEFIEVRRSFKLPYDLLLNEEKLNLFNSQLDDSYHYEDNYLIQEYVYPISDKYSLNKTLDYLRENKYVIKRNDA